MRGVLLFVLFVAIVVGGAWELSGLSGQVSATLAGYTIEIATPLALLALALLVIVLAILLKLLFGLLNLPGNFAAWRARRRNAAGMQAGTQALVAIAAGDAAKARKFATRARRKLGDTPLTLLHAAEAARLAGQDEAAAEFYRKLADHPQAGFLGLRGLFRQAVARQDWEEAARLAREAERAQPAGTWLRDERAEVALRTGNWKQAIALAAPGAPTAAYAVAAVEAETDTRKAIKLALRTLVDAPNFPPAAIAYARLLRNTGKESTAQSVLREAWNRAPHPDLASFALAPYNTPALRFREAQALVSGNPLHAESHFLLASLSLRLGSNEGVVAARSHAEAARAAGMNQQRLFRLLADIDAADLTGATLLRPREALRQAAAAEPDPVWRCESCGTAVAQWSAVCPHCHSAGHIAWGSTTQTRQLTRSGDE